MKKDIVKKSNSLTEAYYSLSVVEYRVLHMVFTALAEHDVNADFYKKSVLLFEQMIIWSCMALIEQQPIKR